MDTIIKNTTITMNTVTITITMDMTMDTTTMAIITDTQMPNQKQLETLMSTQLSCM